MEPIRTCLAKLEAESAREVTWRERELAAVALVVAEECVEYLRWVDVGYKKNDHN